MKVLVVLLGLAVLAAGLPKPGQQEPMLAAAAEPAPAKEDAAKPRDDAKEPAGKPKPHPEPAQPQNTWGYTQSGSESWAYVRVRWNAHMFWWLHKTFHAAGHENRPLIMWLQGGPGGSSTGFGNFELIGPLYTNQSSRPTTWVNQASVLFVDNPVGAGYSFATDDTGFTRTNAEIAQDLVTLFRDFVAVETAFQTTPFYIFGQSYGGKMAAEFAQLLHSEIQAGRITANLAGFAMGNAWIHPLDSTLTWAPFLYSMSLVDENCNDQINRTAMLVKDAVDNQQFVEAVALWRATQGDVNECTNFVDFYNILRFRTLTRNMRRATGFQMEQDTIAPMELNDLMNGPIRDKLGIIPANVTWGGQAGDVFFWQEGDFMKDVIAVLDDILTNTNMITIVYQGQLDLICDNLGAMQFVSRINWPGRDAFYSSGRTFGENPSDSQTELIVKAHQNFKYYWVLNGGHSIARDQPYASYRMLERILANQDV